MTTLLLVLFALSLLTYFIVQRSVASITRTPVWLLWLVMMMPAFIWGTWLILSGGNEQMPFALFIIPFIVCPMLYWFLVQWGRLPTPPQAPKPSSNPKSGEDQTNALAALPPLNNPVRPIDKDEEAKLRGCFPWSVYYVQTVEYRPQALICRGQLRTNPEKAYNTIQEKIAGVFGDRFLVVFQEGVNGKPFFALVNNPQARKSPEAPADAPPVTRPLVAIGLLLATLLTTTLAGAWLMAPPDDVFNPTRELLMAGIPYALSIMAILGLHELAHYLTARRYAISVTLPYFIPVPPAAIFPFGTFGAFIQMRSPIPNRKALFDVGIAGPLAGFVVTIPLLIVGLILSDTVSMTDESGLLSFDALDPRLSFVLMLLAKVALGSQLTADTAINLHPVAIAGCLGLVVTALNLMPVGQLDGGHIVHAMFGQRMGATIGQVARFLVLALAFVQPDFFIWAVLLFLMPAVDQPALNDVTELDNSRDLLGLITLGILILIVLPAPPMVVGWLL